MPGIYSYSNKLAPLHFQHPIHLHLVRFKTVGRYPITFDSTATEDGLCNVVSGAVNGVCLKQKNSTLHDGTVGVGYQALFPSTPTLAYDNTSEILLGEEYLFDKGGCNDVVIALPGQVTKIRAKFDKPGIYVWHCHILSHEDHEMMRRFEVS